jgi:hypothetical protein
MRLEGIGLGASVDLLAAAIQKQEGWYPGSPSYRNNNPGNLIYVGQSGAIGADANGFAVFPDYSTGYQALVNQLNLDASRGMTVDQLASSWAPAGIPGNDPTLYSSVMAGALGVDPSTGLQDALAGTAGGGGSGGGVDSTTLALALGIVAVGVLLS